jgi:hypothetical protein
VERDPIEVAQQFARDLGTLHQKAGRPSYATLERLSGHQLKRATVSDVLNGNRVRVPDWAFVAAFVQACHRAASENGLDPQLLGSVADWKLRWDAASIPQPGASGTGPAGLSTPPGPAASSVPHPRGAPGTAPGPPPEPARDPAGSQPPVVGGLPPRLTGFCGRHDVLEDVRRALAWDNRTGAVAIQGLCGVGKTQLVIEYAYRHWADYDLIWWVPCDDKEAAVAALTELEARLNLGGQRHGTQENRFAAVHEVLRLGQRYPRWLIVLDNANDPDEIRDLLPSANGHTLITTRNSRWDATQHLFELPVFQRAESVDFLRQRLRRISEADAYRLAEAVGDLPLVLEHAVEAGIPVPGYLARLESDPLDLLASRPSAYHMTVAQAWTEVISQLQDSSEHAWSLLRSLSFFGTEPISRELLKQGRQRPDVSIHELLDDSIQLNLAVSTLGRSGLLRVDIAAQTLRMHRITQCVVRHLTAKGDAADAGRRRHDVHLLLAAADPGDPDNPDDWPRYEELRGDAIESGAEGCRAEPVRRLVVNLVRYLCACGDLPTAAYLTDSTLSRWSDGGGDESAVSEGLLELQRVKAGLLLLRGYCQDAVQVRQNALSKMRQDPARWREQIVVLGRVPAASLRAAGQFGQSLAVSREVWAEHTGNLGREHPQTFVAADDLIKDLALTGDIAGAAELARRTYDDCLAYYRVPGHPLVLAQQNSLARCLALTGDYAAAWAMQQDVSRGYAPLRERAVLDHGHPRLLEHEIDYAVAIRELGADGEHLDELAAGLLQVFRRCWTALGVGHPLTLAAAVVRVSTLRWVPGRSPDAAREIGDLLRLHRDAMPGHPHTFLCQALAGGIRRQLGSPVRAVAELQAATESLRNAVGTRHPYTLVAALALTNALADGGETEDALVQGREVLAGFTETAGSAHPHTLGCAANVAMLAALAGERGADRLREQSLGRLRQTLGGTHPYAVQLAEGRRFDLDFTPLPL